MDQSQFATQVELKRLTSVMLRMMAELMLQFNAAQLALSSAGLLTPASVQAARKILEDNPAIIGMRNAIAKLEGSESDSIEDILKNFEGPIQ